MTRPERLDNDIGGRCQAAEQIATVGGIEVRRDAALRGAEVP